MPTMIRTNVTLNVTPNVAEAEILGILPPIGQGDVVQGSSTVLGRGRLRAIARPEAVPNTPRPARTNAPLRSPQRQRKATPRAEHDCNPSGLPPARARRGPLRAIARPEDGPGTAAACRSSPRSPRRRGQSRRPGEHRARPDRRSNPSPTSAPTDRYIESTHLHHSGCAPLAAPTTVGFGSVRTPARRVAMTARVTFAPDGAQVWTRSYRVGGTDVRAHVEGPFLDGRGLRGRARGTGLGPGL